MSKYAGFNSVQLVKPQRSDFDLSHTRRLSTRAGRLTPVFVSEAIPGDTFNGSIEILLRAAPLLAPIYDMLTMFVHVFFVPYRILWDEWEEFITGGRLGVGIDPIAAPIPPYYDFYDTLVADEGYFAKSNLLDYLGMPIITAIPGYAIGNFAGTDASFDIIVPVAYQKIYMDYYRDRNFVPDDDIQIPVGSGEMIGLHEDYLQVRTRSYQHDYFTSALPSTQRGQEVLMPLAGTGSVTYLDRSLLYDENGTTPMSLGALSSAAGVGGVSVLTQAGGTGAGQIQNIDEVTLDASSVSINDFRGAYALQVWLERNEIAGSRYNESTFAHFGVRPQDSRLQRAEYIGGGAIPVKISEIVSTAYSSDGEATVPLANLAGHGITYGNTNQFRYFCPEHGVIIGIASIMAPGSYHQGMPRYFDRKTFLDYPWPTFAKLGEQTVNKYELFASAANLTKDDAGLAALFGYQSRYADWKHIHNTLHGDFHDSLLFWTLARNFASSPTLSQEFNWFDDASQNRIFAVNGSSDNFWLYVHNHVRVRRCLPYFGTPNNLGFN